MKESTAALLLLCLALLASGLLGLLRESPSVVVGDEQTYLSMAASLALDGDLRFGSEDRERLEGVSPDDRRPVILHRVGGRFYFSKPATYPLLVAPFYRLLGSWGLPLANLLLLAGALELARRRLRDHGPAGRADLTVATFAGAGALLAQVAWRMSDLPQLALVMIGAFLCLPDGKAGTLSAESGSSTARARLLAGGALLGTVISMRPPSALLAAGLLAGFLASGLWRRAALVGLGLLLGLALLLGANRALVGAALPHKAQRATFTRESGYPAGKEKAAAEEQLRREAATHLLGLQPKLRPRASIYSGLYFLVGRHTGLLAYFPAALLLAPLALRSKDRARLGLLAGAALLALFYLIWMPHNYFGGGSFVGNRYFLAPLGALLPAVATLPSRRSLAALWIFAAAVWMSAAASVWQTRHLDPYSQNHAYAGIFRALPYESTAQDISGRRDRYWSSGFVRFVDPYAQVGDWKFQLEAGDPAAELLLVAPDGEPRVRFWVYCEAEEAELRVRQGLRVRTFPVGSSRGGPGLVELELGRSWRRHSFWWDESRAYPVHSLRMALGSPDPGAVAKIRYLGGGAGPASLFARTVEGLALPSVAEAGGRGEVSVRVRNTSGSAWSSDSVLPVYLSYRIFDLEEAGSVREGPRRALSGPVEPGGVLEQELDVSWPSRPGRYRLVVDLLLEEVAWFSDRVGEPLGSIDLDIGSPGQS